MDKQLARTTCLKRLQVLPNKQVRDKNLNLLLIKALANYQIVGSYCPIKQEPIIRIDNKTLVFPVIVEKEIKFYENKYGFKDNKYQILEPIIKDQKEVIPEVLVIPCVGYYHNYRLGYGGGYYDKYLVKHQVFAIGVAYEETELTTLNLNKYDISLNKILII